MSAEDPTAAELLAEVNKAILALLQKRVASYTVHGVSYTYAELDKLRDLRNQLRKEVNGEVARRILLADVSGRAS